MTLKKQLLSENVIKREELAVKKQESKTVCGVPEPSFPSIDLTIKRNPTRTSSPAKSNIGAIYNKKLTFYDFDNFDGVSEDLLRKASNSLWKENSKKISLNPNGLISFESGPTLQASSYFQRVIYSGLDRDLLDPDDLPTGSFYDLHFDLPVPIEPEGALDVYPIKQNWEVFSNYNFYVKDYEDSIENASIPERILPNASIIYSEVEGQEDSRNLLPVYNQRFWLHSTLSRRLRTAKEFTYRGFKTNEANVKTTTFKYFDDFGGQVNGIYKKYKEDIDKNVSEISQNIFVTGKDYETSYLDSLKTQRQYPMSSELQVPTFRNFDDFGRVLKNSNIDNYLMSFIKREQEGPTAISPRKLEDSPVNFKGASRDFKVVESTAVNTLSLVETNSPLKTYKKNLRVFSVDYWLNDLLQTVFVGNNKFSLRVFGDNNSSTNSLFLGKLEESLRDLSDDDFKNLRSLSNLFFTKSYLDIINKKQRTPEQIFSGKKSHSEVAFYLVKKTDEFGNVISYYFINPHGQETMRLVDTQVKFGKKYRLEVTQYVFVVGSKYNYTNKLGDASTDAVYISSVPLPILVEVPLFNTSFSVVDANPMPPEVSVNFYKDVDNKALFVLKPGLGRATKKPVFIDDEDFPSEEPINFEKDDRPKEYIAYALKSKPRDYRDFSGSSKRFPVELSDSKSFVLDMEPNRDYWVTFRSKDVHDKLSNPTEVWQIRIVSENGLVFPQTKIYNFEENFEKEQFFNKRLRVEPSELQLQVNNEKLRDKLSSDVKLKDIELENTSEKIWDVDNKDRKFKLRITSKETGKSLDVNFKMILQRKLGE